MDGCRKYKKMLLCYKRRCFQSFCKRIRIIKGTV